MSTIEVDEQTAKRLRMLAALQGLTIADYLRSLAGTASSAQETGLSELDFDAELEELMFDGPCLPADFSRADIYCDHD